MAHRQPTSLILRAVELSCLLAVGFTSQIDCHCIRRRRPRSRRRPSLSVCIVRPCVCVFIECPIVHSPDSRDVESEVHLDRLRVAGRSQQMPSKADGKIVLQVDVERDFHVALDLWLPRVHLSCWQYCAVVVHPAARRGMKGETISTRLVGRRVKVTRQWQGVRRVNLCSVVAVASNGLSMAQLARAECYSGQSGKNVCR